MSSTTFQQHHKKVKRLFFLQNPLLAYFLTAIVLGVGTYLMVSLFKELNTPNFNFHGTHYDFLAFYSAGSTVIHHQIPLLYDPAHMTALQLQIIPHPVGASGYMPILNPPFVAVFLAPLAWFNINTARLLWLAITIFMAFFIFYQLTKPLPVRQKMVAFVLLSLSFPIYQTFIEGQLSLLVLLGACLSFMFLRRGSKILSGASLVLLWVLPQFAVFAVIGLIVGREWKILKGMCISSLAIGLMTLPITGIKVYFSYIHVLAAATGNHFVNMNTSTLLTWRGTINGTMGINGFYMQLIGQNHTKLVNVLYALTSTALLVFLACTIYKMRRGWNTEQGTLIFAASLLISCLIDPHLYAQDIVVAFMLIPALIVLYKRYALQAIIVFAAVTDLVILDQYSRLHFFTLIAIVAAIYYMRKSILQKKAY